MIIALDHIAIAVSDLPEGIRRFVEDFGLTLSGSEAVPSEATETAFFPLPGTQVELISPIEAGVGSVARSLERRGPGIHHLCFQSDDLEADMAQLKQRGYRLLSDAPKSGAHGTRVAFVHPKSTGGVLIELVEHPSGGG